MKRSVFRWLQRLFAPKSKQTTFCYCPICDHELCGSEEVKCWHDTSGLVHFECKCGFHSQWDFDMPCPLLLTTPKPWERFYTDTSRRARGR